MTVVSIGDHLRRRREQRDREQRARRAGALAGTAAELRARARPLLDAGRLDLAASYLDEAALFDAASVRAGSM